MRGQVTCPGLICSNLNFMNTVYLYAYFRPFVLVRVIVIGSMWRLSFHRSITITSTVPQGGPEHEHDSGGERPPPRGGSMKYPRFIGELAPEQIRPLVSCSWCSHSYTLNVLGRRTVKTFKEIEPSSDVFEGIFRNQ
jgi:hypothetical protein